MCYTTEIGASWLNQLFKSNNYQSGKQIPSLRSRDRKAVCPLLTQIFRYRSLNLSSAFPNHGGKVRSKCRKLHSRELDNYVSSAFLLLIVWFNLHPAGVGIWSLSRGLWKTWVFLEQKKAKLWFKRHFVESKTEIVQHVLKCSKFPCCLNIKNEFLWVFS